MQTIEAKLHTIGILLIAMMISYYLIKQKFDEDNKNED
jgi:hypothetical protein